MAKIKYLLHRHFKKQHAHAIQKNDELKLNMKRIKEKVGKKTIKCGEKKPLSIWYKVRKIIITYETKQQTEKEDLKNLQATEIENKTTNAQPHTQNVPNI